MRKKRIIVILAAVIIAAAAVLNYMGNQSFTVTFYRIQTDKDVAGLRLALLSDLHNREYGEGNSDLIEKTEQLAPDIIVIAGDMINYTDPDHSIALNLVEKLSAIAPVYYSAGNHEVEEILRNGNSTLREDIAAAGGVYLSGTYVEAEAGKNRVLIGGVCKNASDILKYEQSMLEDFTKETKFKILISHFPEIFESSMEGYPVDLALCGHAHGGWIRLPFGDGIYSPDQGFFPKYTSGVRELCGSTVVISRGLGNSHKLEFRINNRPELVIVDVN